MVLRQLYAAKSRKSCPTLCDPIDVSPPGSPAPGILQARTRVGCHFPLQCMKVKSLSCVRLLATPWTVAHQASPSMGFPRQERWSGVPLPSPRQLYSHMQNKEVASYQVSNGCLVVHTKNTDSKRKSKLDFKKF